jgi:N-acyl-D-amino-acid deacylase
MLERTSRMNLLRVAERRLGRRQFLVKTGITLALAAGPRWAVRAAANPGLTVAQAFDREMESFMSARKVPGGALAVVRNAKLVYGRGYGYADRERKEAVTADSLFRLASLSKPITAVALMKLAEAGRVDLEAPVTEVLKLQPGSSEGKEPDRRWRKITLLHCLQHTGGWDRGVSGDPMFKSQEIARAAGVPSPARQTQIMEHMLRQPLDFDPGTRYAYSNFGYCLLGQVIERVSGLPYPEYVQSAVLRPLGIEGMRPGASLEHDRATGEVRYYTSNNRQTASVFASHPGQVPAPYGGFCLEAMDAHGGWLASARDLASLIASLDQQEGQCCLRPESLRRMYEAPRAPVSRSADGALQDHFYACGWDVRPVRDGRANYWHNGSLPGTFTMLVRRHDGLSWVALFNQRSDDPKLPDRTLDAALHRAADAVSDWGA